MMSLPPQPLSPLDGRYRAAVESLGEHLSEAGLNRARVHVEVEWLIAQTDRSFFGTSPPLDDAQKAALRKVVTDFGQADIDELATLEATTRHDVKAVEYYVRRRLADLGLDAIAELTHFAATSEDINNLSYAITVRDAVQQVWLPKLRGVIETIAALAREHRDAAMLSRTHGQPATPLDDGQGARGLRAPPAPHRAPDRGDRVPRQVLGRDGHVLGARRRGSGCPVAHGLARVRRVARPHLEPPSRRRSSRTTGRPSSTVASPMRIG